MTDKAISPLRRRLIEDMTIRRLSPKSDGARRFWVGPSKQRGDQLLCTPYPCGTLLADSEFASALIYDLSFG